MLHQLDDQSLSARNVTKSVATARQLSHIPSMLTDAWSLAQEVPAGPVWVEIPEDLLLASAESIVPVQDVRIGTSSLSPRAELIAEAVQLLNNSVRPVILAGGGVRRSPGGSPSLARLAERLDASVVSTVGGKGAISFDHPLSAASWIEDRHTTNLLANADVLIAVGTSMGEVTSNYFTLELSGRLIHIDAEVRVLESNFAGLAIHSDAALAMDALTAGVSDRRPSEQTSGARVAADLRQRVESRLDSFELTIERSLLRAVRDGTPSDAHTFWDMTIAGYWAWSAWDPQIGAFESAQASGGLGFAFPAALAASIGMGRRTLAVTGDGGAMYSISELATAVQHQADVTWLIIDDGGYGILREYMTRAFGVATTTELGRPDFVALAHAFGIDAVTATPDDVGAHIEESWSLAGPRVIVVNQVLRMFPQT
jgi:acetolactate synthase-1/2/3 large subunit